LNFSNRFQRINLACEVTSGALWRQVSQFEKPVQDVHPAKSLPDLGTRTLDDPFLLSLIAWRTTGIAISLGAERSGSLYPAARAASVSFPL
jgi:hypothetical protein